MILRTSKEIKTLQSRLKKIFPLETDKNEIYLGQPKEIEIIPDEPLYAKIRVSDPSTQNVLNFIAELREGARQERTDLKVYISATTREPSEKQSDF